MSAAIISATPNEVCHSCGFLAPKPHLLYFSEIGQQHHFCPACGLGHGLRWKPSTPRECDPHVLHVDRLDLYWTYEEEYKGRPIWQVRKNDIWLADSRSQSDLLPLALLEVAAQNLFSKNEKTSCKTPPLMLQYALQSSDTKPNGTSNPLHKEASMPATITAPKKVISKPKAPAKPVAPAPAAPAAPAAPPKARVALTEDELQALVNGELQPRDNKGTADQESLGTTDEKGRPKGRPIGVTTGLPITAAWSYIFQVNEKQPVNEKWTDEQISGWMKEEFPGRATPAFDHPAGCRADYNAGKFSKGVAPTLQSNQYSADGQIVAPRQRGVKAAPAEESAAPAPAPVAAKPKAATKPVAPAAAPVAAKPRTVIAKPKPAAVKA
jgi:hypothetical protein